MPAVRSAARCSFPRIVLLLAVAAAGGRARAGETPKATADVPKPGAIEGSVVKVFATVRYPDPFKPWTKQSPSDVSGSGVVIGGKRILTNAHVVLYAGQVQIQANQAGDKLPATVEMIAPDMDLAVLKLDDETFFDAHRPLACATTLPEIKDTVLAYGYPTGGNSLSITKGIVSRIEFSDYSRFVSGLRIQIDAAINPGNSGGPAVSGDAMIGLAFSRLGGTESIAYIIPCEEIELFLRDIEDGRYDGKPVLLDDMQTLENDALRAFLKVDKATGGIVIHDVYLDDPTYPLKEWDVIARVGDTRVDDQGMVPLGANLRVRFQYLIQRAIKNGQVRMTIVRDGKERTVDVPVTPAPTPLVPDLQGAYPSYFVYGPLVFSNASVQFFGGLGGKGVNPASAVNVLSGSLMKRLLDLPKFPGESLVVLSSPFFPHKLVNGYGNQVASVVRSVNGIAIKNLAHLVEVLRDAKDEFVVIEFDRKGGEALVFPRKAMVDATDEILTDNGVRSQGSPDVMAIWKHEASRP